MIERRIRTAYHSSLVGRDFLTKRAAIRAEAREIIKAKHPTEGAQYSDDGSCTERGWDWTELKNSDVLLRRMCRLVNREVPS